MFTLKTALHAAIFASLICAGCKHQDQKPSLAEPGGSTGAQDDPHSVQVRLTPLSVKPDESGTWIVLYDATRFQMNLSPPQGSGPFQFGKGSFSATAGTPSGPFLNALAKALDAKSPPPVHASHVQELDLTYAFLGKDMSRSKDGGFSEQPAGGWIAMKIFLPAKDGDDAEVYLNFDASTGIAEFSEKDPDYGDAVVKTMAKIF